MNILTVLHAFQVRPGMDKEAEFQFSLSVTFIQSNKEGSTLKAGKGPRTVVQPEFILY